MKKSQNPLHSQSHTGFVMINGTSKEQRPTRWQWLTQRNQRQSQDIPQQSLHPRLSYSQKKNILSGLECQRRSFSNFKIKDGFAQKQKLRAASTASCASLRSVKKLQPFVYLNSNDTQMQIPSVKFGIDVEELSKVIVDANKRSNRVIGIISIRRMGLRFRLNHTFVEHYSTQQELKDISVQLKKKLKQYAFNENILYYFTTQGQPVNNYRSIQQQNLKVLIVDSSPKLQFSQSLRQKIKTMAKKIIQVLGFHESLHTQKILRSQKKDSEGSEAQQEVYDYQRIKNVKQYVQKMSQNPYYRLSEMETSPSALQAWYGQKYTSIESPQKQSDKNLLFQSKCHFPKEALNKKLLHEAGRKVQNFNSTVNRHKFIPTRIDLMMQQVKRDEAKQKTIKSGTHCFEAPITKKDMLYKLDKKNNLLSNQNLPYLIQKYGLNRFEIYNLYNLYKSFEKVAVMRHPDRQSAQTITKKGIDRQTFQVGLKGLDMNPGDELIKGICYFGDYISWEQFIKIISISLRKTPEQKLTAILKSISSFDNAYLSRHQISMMIGNSLHKLFDHDEDELKQYFTDMAMAQFDPQKTGKVPVDVMKSKVLGQTSGNMNMVSFLILNT